MKSSCMGFVVVLATAGLARSADLDALKAQADSLSNRVFAGADLNRDKSLSEKEAAKAESALLVQFAASCKKLRANGPKTTRVLDLIRNGQPDADTNGTISAQELRDFVRDAWSERLEIIFEPPPQPVVQLPPPVVVLGNRKDDEKDDLEERRRREELRRELERERRREMEREQQMKKKESSPPPATKSSGSSRVTSRSESSSSGRGGAVKRD